MQMIRDGSCQQLHTIIESAAAAAAAAASRSGSGPSPHPSTSTSARSSASTSATFSAIATVIENRKLEIFKPKSIKSGEEKERLEIHVADQTCQLFKFTFWGQAAVYASSKFCPGVIILLDNFVAKSRCVDVVEGICGESTTTHVLYNKFGITFEEQRFPIMYKSMMELVKFSQNRYPLLYPRSHISMLTQILCGSQLDEQGMLISDSNCDSQVVPPLLLLEGQSIASSCSVRDDLRLVAHATTPSVPIKTFTDYRSIQQQQQQQESSSLRIKKDLLVSIRDVIETNNEISSGPLTDLRLETSIVSRRWKVRDARTYEQLFLCFDTKKAAWSRANKLFHIDYRDNVLPILSEAGSTLPLLVNASGLLILRESGRSLTSCHSKLTLGDQRSSFVQELLVSEDTVIQILPMRQKLKRRSEKADTMGKRKKCDIVLTPDLQVHRDTYFRTLEDCCFMGFSINCQVLSGNSYRCENVACDAFLWQLFDLEKAGNWLEGDNEIIETHIEGSGRLTLSYPCLKYNRVFFFFKMEGGDVVQLPVIDFAEILGGIPAPMLFGALLMSRCPHTAYCVGCKSSMNHMRHKYQHLCAGIKVVGCDRSEMNADVEVALSYITVCVKRVLRALSSSTAATQDVTGSACNVRFTMGGCKNAKPDISDNLYVVGTGEKFKIRISVSSSSTFSTNEYEKLSFQNFV